MISLVKVEQNGERSLVLSFSDGSWGVWHADAVIAFDTVLTRPLEDPSYFARAFIESDALAWPNGLEFSARGLQRTLAEAGTLVEAKAA